MNASRPLQPSALHLTQERLSLSRSSKSRRPVSNLSLLLVASLLSHMHGVESDWLSDVWHIPCITMLGNFMLSTRSRCIYARLHGFL